MLKVRLYFYFFWWGRLSVYPWESNPGSRLEIRSSGHPNMSRHQRNILISPSTFTPHVACGPSTIFIVKITTLYSNSHALNVLCHKVQFFIFFNVVSVVVLIRSGYIYKEHYFQNTV